MTELFTLSLIALLLLPLVIIGAYYLNYKLHPSNQDDRNLWVISERKSGFDGKTILLNNTLEIHRP